MLVDRGRDRRSHPHSYVTKTVGKTVPLPKAKVIDVPETADSDFVRGYEQLAAELNFLPPQLLENQLVRFLAENHIGTYDYDEVDRYMTALAEKDGLVWIWRPLRRQDKPQHYQWYGQSPSSEFNTPRDPGNPFYNDKHGHGSYCDEPEYHAPTSHLIPIHILRNVKKIQDRFGTNVQFFVTDYATPKPDPFIMVTAYQVPRIIFGVWDEPGFGAESE